MSSDPPALVFLASCILETILENLSGFYSYHIFLHSMLITKFALFLHYTQPPVGCTTAYCTAKTCTPRFSNMLNPTMIFSEFSENIVCTPYIHLIRAPLALARPIPFHPRFACSPAHPPATLACTHTHCQPTAHSRVLVLAPCPLAPRSQTGLGCGFLLCWFLSESSRSR